MPDHIHMLMIPLDPGRHLSRIIVTLKNAIRRRLSEIGISVKWQWGYHDRILRKGEDTADTARYIVMNPVRKGLAVDFRQWPFGGIVDRWF